MFTSMHSLFALSVIAAWRTIAKIVCVCFFFQQLVTQEGQSPAILSPMWVRNEKQVWGKAFVVLLDKKLYISREVCILASFVRAAKIGVSNFLLQCDNF